MRAGGIFLVSSSALFCRVSTEDERLFVQMLKRNVCCSHNTEAVPTTELRIQELCKKQIFSVVPGQKCFALNGTVSVSVARPPEERRGTSRLMFAPQTREHNLCKSRLDDAHFAGGTEKVNVPEYAHSCQHKTRTTNRCMCREETVQVQVFQNLQN